MLTFSLYIIIERMYTNSEFIIFSIINIGLLIMLDERIRPWGVEQHSRLLNDDKATLIIQQLDASGFINLRP